MGHKERLPPSRLSGRCGFGQRTFAGTSGNDKGAPIADLPGPDLEPGSSTVSCRTLDSGRP